MKTAILLICMLTGFSVSAQSFAWAAPFTGSGDGHGNDLIVDAAGNVYSTGYLSGTADFDPGPGVFNFTQPGGAGAYVSKLDAAGNLVWAKQFESWNIVSYAITMDAAGNIYTTGFFQQTADFDPGPGVYNLTNTSGADVFIGKLDNNGNFLWAKQFGGINNALLGCFEITVDGTGNPIITGYFDKTADFDPGPSVYNLTSSGLQDIFVAKLDANGNFLWAKQMNGTSFEQGQAITTDAAGNIYTCGYFAGTVDFDPGAGSYPMMAVGNSDMYLSKLDANGNFIMARQFTGPSTAVPFSMILNPAGDIFLTGYFINVLDADPGPAVFNLASVNDSPDIFLIKLNGNGDFLWAKQIGGTGQDRGNDLSIDASGNIFFCGDFQSTVDVDPGAAVVNFTSAGGFDLMILKLDNAGNFKWAKQIGGAGYEIAYSIQADNAGNIFTTGLFEQTVDFDPGSPVYNLTSGGLQDAFVLKLNPCSGITSSSLTASSCTPYVLNGQTYPSTGTYTQTLLNVAGCDSIITLHLTIGGSVTNLNATSCDNYTWEGQTYTTSGVYTARFTGADGCDSIRKLNLTIKYAAATNLSISICEGQSYAGHTTTGIYVDTYLAANGCDSIRTLNLTVNPKKFTTINAVICEGQSYDGYVNSGTYTDTYAGANSCDSIRTLNLMVNPKKITNINAVICEGQFYFAGGSNQTITGIYNDILQTSLGCDSVIITNLTVNPKPKPDLGIDKDLCFGSSVTLNPGSFNSYAWQDMSNNPVLIVNAAGLYWVTVTNNFNCKATDSIKINTIRPLPVNFLRPKDSICSYEQLILFPLNSYAAYHWSTGSVQSNITVKLPGQYWLTVTDRYGCTGNDTTVIFSKTCITGVFIPTAFTPNNDGKNDTFKARINGNLISFRLQVYDRFGQLVFETANPLYGWTGLYGNYMSSSAVYIWQCNYQLEGEKPVLKKGTVAVIR